MPFRRRCVGGVALRSCGVGGRLSARDVLYGMAGSAFVIVPPRAGDQIKFGTVLHCLVLAGVVTVSSPDGHLHDAAGIAIAIAAHWISGSL